MKCGGPPNIWEVNAKLMEAKIRDFHNCDNAHRLIHHINTVELPNYPNVVGHADNSSLRVDYLMNRITEKQWIKKLKIKMKKQEKNTEIHMVLAMFTTALSDLFDNILSCESSNTKEI